MGPDAIRPSAWKIESCESFQLCWISPRSLLRAYSRKPSPSGSPYRSIQSRARSTCGHRRRAVAWSLVWRQCSAASMTNSGVASWLP